MASPLLLLPALLLSAPSLLQSATLRREENVLRSPLVRDGRATWEGDFWDTENTAILKPQAVLEWDLGETKVIRAAFLQADNNDDYFLSTSEDGESFSVAWKPIPDPIAGMRTRTTATLDVKARYVRLTATGGDGFYSVGELALWGDPKDLSPDGLARVERPPPPKRDASLDSTWWIIVLLIAAVVAFYTRKRWDEPDAPGSTGASASTEPAAAEAGPAAKTEPPPGSGDPKPPSSAS